MRGGISKQTVDSALRKLEHDGVLQTAGGKKKQVSLTGSGELLTQKTALRILRIEDGIFASWSDAALESYIALTEKFLSSCLKISYLNNSFFVHDADLTYSSSNAPV